MKHLKNLSELAGTILVFAVIGVIFCLTYAWCLVRDGKDGFVSR